MIHFLAIFLLGLVLLPYQSTTKERQCMALKPMLNHLVREEGFAYLADGVDSAGHPTFWYLKPKTGEWVQVSVQRRLQACIEKRGTDWHFAMGG